MRVCPGHPVPTSRGSMARFLSVSLLAHSLLIAADLTTICCGRCLCREGGRCMKLLPDCWTGCCGVLLIIAAVLVTTSAGASPDCFAMSSADWDSRLARGLAKFGHHALRPWQHSVLMAWRDHKDVLVLSGTGVWRYVSVSISVSVFISFSLCVCVCVCLSLSLSLSLSDSLSL